MSKRSDIWVGRICFSLLVAIAVVAGFVIAMDAVAYNARLQARFEPRECYVDFINGNDANPGTQEWPFKTMAKAGHFVTQQQSHVGEKRARVSVEAW